MSWQSQLRSPKSLRLFLKGQFAPILCIKWSCLLLNLVEHSGHPTLWPSFHFRFVISGHSITSFQTYLPFLSILFNHVVFITYFLSSWLDSFHWFLFHFILPFLPKSFLLSYPYFLIPSNLFFLPSSHTDLCLHTDFHPLWKVHTLCLW